MYPNLLAEITRCGWSRKQLSEKMNIPYSTLLQKLRGYTPFTFEEAKTIKECLNLNEPLEYIFFKTDK